MIGIKKEITVRISKKEVAAAVEGFFEDLMGDYTPKDLKKALRNFNQIVGNEDQARNIIGFLFMQSVAEKKIELAIVDHGKIVDGDTEGDWEWQEMKPSYGQSQGELGWFNPVNDKFEKKFGHALAIQMVVT